MSTEGDMQVDVCVDGVISVEWGMSFGVDAWISTCGVRRECAGPEQVNDGDAKGGDSAVSGWSSHSYLCIDTYNF